MTQLFAGSFALILALLVWGVSKKSPKTLYRSSRQVFNDLREDKLSLVNQSERTLAKPINYSDQNIWDLPKTKKEKIDLQKKLWKLISGGPKDRLEAVSIASNLNSSYVLPILKRGLKDFDLEIVLKAAQGIEKFRTIPRQLITQESKRPPLNVFLMR